MKPDTAATYNIFSTVYRVESMIFFVKLHFGLPTSRVGSQFLVFFRIRIPFIPNLELSTVLLSYRSVFCMAHEWYCALLYWVLNYYHKIITCENETRINRHFKLRIWNSSFRQLCHKNGRISIPLMT